MRRWFIILLPVTAFIVGSWALYNLLFYGFNLAWAGTAVAAMPILFYFTNLYRYQTPRTTERLDGVTAVIGIGNVLAMSGVFVGNMRFVLPAILALLMLGLWLLYVKWYSHLFRPQNDLLQIGQPLPQFTLHDENGNEVRSSSFLGSQALLIFYRGNWCPFCMAQIRELAESYQELARRGAQVILVSPQPQKETRKLAQRFEVPMRFLVDKDNHVAKQLNIAHLGGLPGGFESLGYDTDTVYPTVIITDATGTILATDQTNNYRIRPEPQAFLQILDSA